MFFPSNVDASLLSTSLALDKKCLLNTCNCSFFSFALFVYLLVHCNKIIKKDLNVIQLLKSEVEAG